MSLNIELKCFKCGNTMGGFIQQVAPGTNNPVINVRPCEDCFMTDKQYKDHIQELMVFQNKYEAIEKIVEGEIKVEVGS